MGKRMWPPLYEQYRFFTTFTTIYSKSFGCRYSQSYIHILIDKWNHSYSKFRIDEVRPIRLIWNIVGIFLNYCSHDAQL